MRYELYIDFGLATGKKHDYLFISSHSSLDSALKIVRKYKTIYERKFYKIVATPLTWL